MMNLSARSLAKLSGVHPSLVRVVHRAVEIATDEGFEFQLTEGLRTEARQRELVAAGASKTMESRHLTGHAVDVVAVVAGGVRWDWPLYGRIANAFKKSASEFGIALVWGGDWKSFKDGPHFELDRKAFPASTAGDLRVVRSSKASP